jgi:hypothetical protein
MGMASGAVWSRSLSQQTLAHTYFSLPCTQAVYTVMYMSDSLLTQENANPHLNPQPDLGTESTIQYLKSVR